jgi:predicted metal-binding membrane protein
MEPGIFPVDNRDGDPVAHAGVQAAVPPRGQGRPSGSVLVGRVTSQAPNLRQLTPLASLLLAVAAVAWVGVVVLARGMGSMAGTMGLGVGSFIAVWALMMAAMMLPSVTPFASLYMRTFGDDRGRRLAGFASGYLIVWVAGALPAYGLAWLAGQLVGVHPAAATVLAVAIFAACGVYQLTPLKDRCLARCRSPLGFVLKLGAYQGRTRDLRVGLYHGAFCLACCWALMALLVAFGLMNVIAMAVLAGSVLVEKTWVWGPRFSRLLGVAALGLAFAVIFVPGLAPGLHQAPSPGGMGGM